MASPSSSPSLGNSQQCHPVDLREALSVTPLMHLIPKQDIAPLLSSANIEPVSSEAEDFSHVGTGSEVSKLRSAMNKNPEQYEKMMNLLVEDFNLFEHPELADITFKRPIIAGETSRTVNSDELNLPPLEKRLFDTMAPIQDDSLRDFNLELDSQLFKEHNSKLNLHIGKDFNDTVKLEKHVKKFNKKFDRAFSESRTNFSRESSPHPQSTSPETNQQVYSQPKQSSKRPIESVGDGLATPDPKRLPKPSSYVDSGELVKQALDNLIGLVDDINQSESDDVVSKYFWSTKSGPTILKNNVFVSILDNLLRLYMDPIIDQLDIDYLTRIEKLCIESLDVAHDTAWNEITDAINYNNQDDFYYLMASTTNHILASKIIILILNGRRTDKVLHLDNYLKSMINFLANIIQDAILPLSVKFEASNEQLFHPGKSISIVVSDLSYILSSMCFTLNGNEIDEEVLTRLEYLCILIVFSEGNFNSKGPVSLQNLSIWATQVLIQIHKEYPDQRQFILNEVLTNFDKLPHQKSIARQVRLPRGGNVQLFTVLLIKLIQSFEVKELADLAKEFTNVKNSNKAVQNTLIKKQNLIEQSDQLYNEAVDVSNEIANFFIKKLNNNPDQNYKATFLLFLDDVSSMLTFPEWPGLETLLCSIMKSFLIVIQSGSYPAVMETFALEMAGKIGTKLLELKMAHPNVNLLNFDSSAEEFNLLKNNFLDTLQFVKLYSNKSREFVSALKILVLKYICMLRPFLMNVNNEKENQIAALNSDNDVSHQGLQNTAIINSILEDLLQFLSEDTIVMNQALNADKDSLSITSYTQVILSQELVSLYDSFTNVIVRSLDSSKIKAKTRAVKILSSLIDQDARILLTPKIQESVSKSLLDGSPLVRDAVIDLISRYMLLKPELIVHFHKRLCDRLNDDSISVRKRVMKLSREMYVNTGDRNVRGHIAMQMLKRLDDEEDSISAMTKQFLLELWFGPVSEKNDFNSYLSIISRVNIMMDIASVGGKSSKYFLMFLVENVMETKESQIKIVVSEIVNATLDYILNLIDTKIQSEIEKALVLLACFVRCNGSLISQDQLVLLQPYLAGERNSSVCFYCLQILKNVLPKVNALRPEFVESTQAFLLRNLTKFDVRELNQAMPSVWLLCKMQNNPIKLANASVSCMRLIKPFMDEVKTGVSPKADLKLFKLLHLLGCFGSYCDFEKIREVYIKANVGIKGNETVTSLITKFLLFFCNGDFEPQVRNVAIKNIIHVCTYHPKLFMSNPILNVLDREFSGECIEIKHSIIQGIISFLNKEDTDSQKRNGAEEKSSKEIKLDVAVFHGDSQSYVNDGICAGIIQRYVDKILLLCISDSGKFSLLPVQFLQLVLKLGFANPKVCIATIIALESSPNGYIRNIAKQLHQELYEKHESLTDSSYIEGLRLAVKYQQKVATGLVFQQTSHLSSIYKIVCRSYSSRKKFIFALSKVFKFQIGRNNVEEAIEQRNLVIYTITNLLEILFSSIEEVLILIYHMDKAISREGMDQAEIITKQKELRPEAIKTSLINSQALLAMLNFRSHLTNYYSITLSQIENYRPNRADIETRQAPKVITVVPFQINDLDLDINLEKLEQFGGLFAKFVQAIKDYT